VKIAFPTQDDLGLESQVYGHFGSANNFIVVDTETDACETVNNRDREHAHGQCQPLAALGGNVTIPILKGEKEVEVKKGTQPGDVMVLKEYTSL